MYCAGDAEKGAEKWGYTASHSRSHGHTSDTTGERCCAGRGCDAVACTQGPRGKLAHTAAARGRHVRVGWGRRAGTPRHLACGRVLRVAQPFKRRRRPSRDQRGGTDSSRCRACTGTVSGAGVWQGVTQDVQAGGGTRGVPRYTHAAGGVAQRHHDIPQRFSQPDTRGQGRRVTRHTQITGALDSGAIQRHNTVVVHHGHTPRVLLR